MLCQPSPGKLHTVFFLFCRTFVFVTKYRRKIITAPILEQMEEIFTEVCDKTGSILI